ncbi:Alpha/beta hydrolase family protein [Streptomyces sp. YIM 130001]|uniref:alpha/beta hydrolase n=1 Tax=Streptomyces sp. YIM 130001 TaxID=2259644 RepID=UPI000E653130|nr:alpha/beta hydrolase [Streptomyces sp. YIM 130001]RII14716.1 Alpha/beta hydrolase family protein [Streptomyces sp. YIM 130001]
MNTEVRAAAYPTGSHTKAVDIHTNASGPAVGPVVLLWHGTGPDERDVLAPLAQAIAALGPTVVVPDWQSDRPDQGREQLTDSLRFALDHSRARSGSPGRLIVGGWSAGAGAALGAVLQPGLLLRPELLGDWRPVAVVGIAGDFRRPARTTGIAPLDALSPHTPRVPVRLVHGTEDTVVPPDSTRAMHRSLLDHGWDTRLTEPATDHAGVLGCAYDPAVRRCVPSHSEAARDAMSVAAAMIASIAREQEASSS